MNCAAAALHPDGTMCGGRRRWFPAFIIQAEEETAMADQTSETPVLDLLGSMTADSLEASSLDPQTLMLVRIAALVAVDAPTPSYLMNLGVAGELDIDAEQVRGVLAAVAPIVGTARVASATGKIVRALAVAIEVAELEEEEAGGQ
jgi:alkylhydroperoxidase/carboxymuconolactone decarboxylase family protein YurZ